MEKSWSKTLTDSDSQQETEGAKMPFRFTQGDLHIDHTTWFRDEFFNDANWTESQTRQGKPIEKADIQVMLTMSGTNYGIKSMTLDHGAYRAQNHRAPTTHLHYDSDTKQLLESQNLTGSRVIFRVVQGDDAVQYHMEID